MRLKYSIFYHYLDIPTLQEDEARCQIEIERQQQCQAREREEPLRAGRPAGIACMRGTCEAAAGFALLVFGVVHLFMC